MDKKPQNPRYLHDLALAPEIHAAILRAARRAPHRLTLDFGRFGDDPFLLLSSWGLARTQGVTLVLPPEKADGRRG